MEINDFYKGNPLLPKAGTKRELTPDQVQEFMKCAADPVYFANNYFWAVHQEHGLMQITPYSYQIDALKLYNELGRLIMLTARQVGKALALSTKVPLYDGGFTTIGDLKVGDTIIGSNGKATKVTFKSEIHHKPTYEITFETGEKVTACEDHLWTVHDTFTPRGKAIKTLTTKEMFEKIDDLKRRGSVENRYKIANIKPVEYPAKDVELDPYILGAWLGDGSSGGAGFTCATSHKKFYEEQGIEFTSDLGFDKNPERVYTSSIKMLGPKLRKYNLIKNKHIPKEYLYNSIEVRRSVLQGLMDTDGYISKKGRCDISIAEHRHPQLIEDVFILLNSLGFKVYRSRAFSKKYGTWHTRFMFMASQKDEVFRIPHKKERLRESLKRDPNFRYINNIVQIENEPTQCITVDAEDHLFAITDSFILTHNTTLATVIILHTALFNKNKNIALLANLQSTAIEILDRIKEAFENLPDFLKQGVKIWNKKTVKFENGCTIFANASKGSSIRGKSIFLLYIDECAFVENWEDFAASTLPTITSNKNAKIIYTSTPNGLNHFYEYCNLAKAKKNGFGYIEVPWYKVDGRDEAWKEKTLQDMNYDLQRFQVEQECLTGDAIVTIEFDNKLVDVSLETLYHLNNLTYQSLDYEEIKSQIHYLLIGSGRWT